MCAFLPFYNAHGTLSSMGLKSSRTWSLHASTAVIAEALRGCSSSGWRAAKSSRFGPVSGYSLQIMGSGKGGVPGGRCAAGQPVPSWWPAAPQAWHTARQPAPASFAPPLLPPAALSPPDPEHVPEHFCEHVSPQIDMPRLILSSCENLL